MSAHAFNLPSGREAGPVACISWGITNRELKGTEIAKHLKSYSGHANMLLDSQISEFHQRISEGIEKLKKIWKERKE